MTRFWTISIVIPGECFGSEDRAEKAVDIGNESIAPEPKKVDVEEVTSQPFPCADDDGEDN